jgi:Amt family ammonium transporter
VLGTMMQSVMALAIISVQWIVVGYSLGFGPDRGHVIGGLDWIGLRGVGMTPNPDYAATIPHQAYMIYQCMFAVITPALITGAIAERMKFKTYLVFMLLWMIKATEPLAFVLGAYLAVFFVAAMACHTELARRRPPPRPGRR